MLIKQVMIYLTPGWIIPLNSIFMIIDAKRLSYLNICPDTLFGLIKIEMFIMDR